MKKYLVLALASLFAFASCSKETNETPEMNNDKTVVLSFTSKRPQLKSESKTAWDANLKTIVWSEGDKIRVGYTIDGEFMGKTGEGDVKFYASEPVTIGSSANIGTFKVPIDDNSAFIDPKITGPYVFYGVYPSSASVSGADVTSAPAISLEIPTSQKPGVSTFDVLGDIMLGKTASMTISGLPTSAIDIAWTRIVAHGDLTFKDFKNVEEGEKIMKITLTAQDEAKLVGRFKASLENGAVTDKTTASNEIVIQGTNLDFVTDNEGKKNINAWVCLLPETLTDLIVDVETNKAHYTRTFNNISKTFKVNARNILGIGMSSATRTSKTGQLVENGYYVISYDDKMMTVGTESDSFRGYTDLNTTNPSEDAIWKIEYVEAEDAYTIHSVDIDKDLYGATGDYTYLTFSSSSISTNYFTIEKSSPDASTYTITPLGNTIRHLGYNTNDNQHRFALYKGATAQPITIDLTPVTYVVGPSIKVTSDNPITVANSGGSQTIEYTIKNPTTGSTLTANTTATWITGITVNSDNVTFNVSAQETGAAERTGSIILSYPDANDVTVTINQDAGLSIKTIPYEESFASGQGDFTIDNIALDGLNYVWSHDNSNKYMKASAYVSGTNHDVESLLVSPIIEIPSVSAGESIKLKFSQCISKYFGSVENEASLFVKEIGGDWTKVSITYPTISSGSFSAWDDQTVDLSSYAGKSIQIAFKYVGTSSACGTWEIKNVSVKKYEPFALSSISVSGQKTIFTVGDTFSFGGTVTATYNDETTADVTTSATFTGYNMSNTGNQTVTVSYTEGDITKTTSYEITVNSASVETVVYTLNPVATGGNSQPHNSYSDAATTTISGIEWSVTGNSSMVPWRIGGKSISNVDREIYSTTKINKNISKIDITHGAASSITINSMTVIVSTNADFSNPVSTLTPTFTANSTVTVERPNGADWSNCYYKIIYNVSVSGNTNRFIEFSKAEFTGK